MGELPPEAAKAAQLLSCYAEPGQPCEHCLGMDDDRVWEATHTARLLRPQQIPRRGDGSMALCDYHTQQLVKHQGPHWVITAIPGSRIGCVPIP